MQASRYWDYYGMTKTLTDYISIKLDHFKKWFYKKVLSAGIRDCSDLDERCYLLSNREETPGNRL